MHVHVFKYAAACQKDAPLSQDPLEHHNDDAMRYSEGKTYCS